ncbi:hypothetical protein KC336_g19165 [Hortaea werneckii]|nr:hypothetical protein KC336_g19165 [Hortaea werneckii]
MVDGGNSRLIERLIKLSGARLSLSSEVIAIGRGEERRYRLTIRHGSEGTQKIEYVEYDSVVLAAPLQLLNIDLSGLSLSPNTASPATTDPIEAHITHFISPFNFNANFSNLSLNISITNDDILTSSSPPGAVNILKVQGSGVTYTLGCPPDTGCDCYGCESLYRIHSHRALDDAELVRLLGIEYNEALSLILLWVRRDVWPKAFLPYRNGSDFVGEMDLARHLYYTGGGEEIMSSMEMSCRMGERVAAGLAFGLQGGFEL